MSVQKSKVMDSLNLIEVSSLLYLSNSNSYLCWCDDCSDCGCDNDYGCSCDSDYCSCENDYEGCSAGDGCGCDGDVDECIGSGQD